MQDSNRILQISQAIEPRFFKALCDPNRIAILIQLAHEGKPITVSRIAGC